MLHPGIDHVNTFYVDFITDEADTDLETDRLLGQLRTDDIGYYEPQTVWILFHVKILVLELSKEVHVLLHLLSTFFTIPPFL